MTKAELVKRIIPLIKDEKELRKFAEIGLPYAYDLTALLDMYEKLIRKQSQDNKEESQGLGTLH